MLNFKIPVQMLVAISKLFLQNINIFEVFKTDSGNNNPSL